MSDRDIAEQIGKEVAEQASLDIPLDQLDAVAARIPKRMFDWGIALADIKKRVKQQQRRVKSVFAELDIAVRRNPQEYGLEKVTEASVTAVIEVNELYKEAVDRAIQLEYNKEVIENYLQSLSEMGREIRNLTELFAHMYWAKPNTSGMTKDSRVAAQRESSAKINKTKR